MVCQKSRDRLQGPQKQRSLPPKKRTIPEAAPPPATYCTSAQVLSSTIAGEDSTATVTTSHRPNHQAPAPVSADDRSIGNSSTASQASFFTNSMTVNNNNKYMVSVKMTSAMAPSAATTVPVATVTTKTTTSSSSKSAVGLGIMPFVSNDSQFVASTLRQRESLEVYRAAKAMLYDAYIKAVNEQQAP